MIYQSIELEEKAIMQTAAKMCAVARTAPKAHGKDTIKTLVFTGEDKELLARKMEAVGIEQMGEKMPTWYGRDADCVRAAQAVVLIGAKKAYRGVPHCGFCGFENCGECSKHGSGCAYSYMDLGIAVSSAVSAAAMDMVDNRIMLSVGKAAATMPELEDTIWLGIPISISGKNIFFDRGIFHE